MGSLRSETSVYTRVMTVLSLINTGMAWLSAVILLCATLFVFLEIMSRFFLGKSLIWVIEISGYSLLYMTFLGAPYMLEKHRHVAIDILLWVNPFVPGWQSSLACCLQWCASSALCSGPWFFWTSGNSECAKPHCWLQKVSG